MEPFKQEPAVLIEADQDGKRGRLSRRTVLGGIAAAGVGAAASTLVAGCDKPNNASKGESEGPPSYGTGIDDGFNGKIELDVRDSKADWTPYELKRAPKDAPNVLVVLYDDTGLAAGATTT
jgi:hypothetical protein